MRPEKRSQKTVAAEVTRLKLQGGQGFVASAAPAPKLTLEQRRFVTAAEKVDFRSPWTLEEWLCRSDVVPNQDLLMVRANMEAGHSHPFHTHPTREEIIYVLSGRAEQWVGAEHRVLGPGEMVLVPKGEAHGTYNPFRERLVFLAILAPAQAAEPGIVDISREEPWASLRQKHGLTVCQIANEAR